MQTKSEYHFNVADNGMTAVDFITSQTDFSKSLVKKIMLCGAVWLSQGSITKRLRRASKVLKPKQKIHLYYDPHIIATKAEPCELIADEKDYSVWYKPAGVFSQGTKYGDHCTVQRWAEKTLIPQRNAFIVHRLDRDAQGLILLAHTKHAAAALSKIFHDRLVEKHYHAIVQGHLKLATLPFKICEDIDNKQAITTVLDITYNKEKDESLVIVSIQTGRKHQIRKHMANLHHPIVGDRLYSVFDKNTLDKKNEKKTMQLYAKKLSFICPITHQKKLYQL